MVDDGTVSVVRPPVSLVALVLAGILAIVVAVGPVGPVGAVSPISAVSPVAAHGTQLPTDGDPIVRAEEGQVIRLYRAVLDRRPDDGGFAFWTTRLQTGWTIDRVAAGFVQSREFALVYGSPDDDDFVRQLYRNVLDREPDPAGERFWIDQMAAGLSRTRVVVLFSESPEFRTITDTDLVELPPFEATVSTVTAEDLGPSWRPGCPVGPDDLRRIDASHVGFDGLPARGALIVHADVVDDVVGVLEVLWAERFPIESMRTVDEFYAGLGPSDDLFLSDIASMEANNTSAFNCRAVARGTAWSNHAFGRAVDINPRQNPYVTSSEILPSGGEAFLDRSIYHPAMIREGDVVVSTFAALGWRWGGDFSSIKDWHHFDRTG